jgi:hypothetical protein
MNVSANITKYYESISNSTLGENKPNSNPISQKPRIDVNSILSKDYINNYPCGAPKNKPKTNPISRKPKSECKLIADTGLRESALRGLPENKPNQTQFHTRTDPPAGLSDGLYKLSNDEYHGRPNWQCSSMLKHSFRRAKINGSTRMISCNGAAADEHGGYAWIEGNFSRQVER